MKNPITSSDIYDTNKKSGALILGKNRLDDYATKFLTKYCKQALATPMPLPVDQILLEMDLTVQKACLSSNSDIFGCCLLLDSSIDIYDRETKQYNSVDFEAGTILVDPILEEAYGKGFKRNTLIHEVLHWEKDKCYFEILKIKNQSASEKLCPIMCKQSETFFEPAEGKKTKENEVRWLEWQAHRLAPRILMPKDSFKKKAEEIIRGYTDIFCSGVIKQLSDFFEVSFESAKYRIIEVGLRDAVSELADYEDVYADVENSTEYVKLTPAQAIKFLDANSTLRTWVTEGKYIFVDGYFVLDDERYVGETPKGIHLTQKAKINLPKCVLNIREYRQTWLCHSDDVARSYSTLFRIGSVDDRVLTFHPNYQTPQFRDPETAYKAFNEAISSYDETEEIELMKMIGDPTKTLCDCLCFLMENRNWKYPQTFNETTGLHENYHGKIKKNDQNNMKTNTLMAICVGMKLCLRMTIKLFDKSTNKLNYYNDPDKTYIRIMEMMPGLSLDEFNSILKESGVEELGTVAKE